MKIKYDKNLIRKSFGLLSLFAAIFIGVGFYLLSNIYHLVYEGEKTTGKVVSVDVDEDDDGTTYTPTVEYVCGGVAAGNKGDGSSKHYHVGDIVTIYCDPQEPDNFMIKSFGNYFIFLLPLVGFLILYLGLREFKIKYKTGKLRKNLKIKGNGLKVRGIVDNIAFGNVEIFGQKGYTVSVKYNNKSYKSPNIYADIIYVLKEGDEVDLYISRENTDDYWIDLDEILEKEIDATTISENLKKGKSSEESKRRIGENFQEMRNGSEDTGIGDKLIDSINDNLPPENKIDKNKVSGDKVNTAVNTVFDIVKFFIGCRMLLFFIVIFFILSGILDSVLDTFYGENENNSKIAFLIVFVVLAFILLIYYNKQKNKKMKDQSVGVYDYDEKKYNKLNKPLSSYVGGSLLAFLIVGIIICGIGVFGIIASIIQTDIPIGAMAPLLGLIGFGLIFLIIGRNATYKKIKYKRLRKKLKEFGLKKDGIITEIKSSGGRIDKQQGYKIIAFVDNNTICESEVIYCDVFKYISGGDHIDIYFDSEDPSKYWMDVDSIN